MSGRRRSGVSRGSEVGLLRREGVVCFHAIQRGVWGGYIAFHMPQMGICLCVLIKKPGRRLKIVHILLPISSLPAAPTRPI